MGERRGDDDPQDATEAARRDPLPVRGDDRALAESEERLRLALSSANQGLYDLDVQSGNATVSPEYATMLGYDPATFCETNQAWIERLHPDDRERVTEYFRAYVTGDTDAYRVEFRQRTHQGDWRWILSIGRIVSRRDDGSPLRMLGTHTDITDKKLAEDQLRRSEQDLAITLQSIGDGVIATDADGRVTRINPMAERMTGWSAAEAVGRPLGEVFRIVTAGRPGPALDPVRAVLDSGQAVALSNHTTLLARDGRVVQISDSAAPIRDPDGRILGVVLVFSDVTEQYRVQRALHESEQRLRTIIEHEPECVKVVAADGRLLEMNAAGLAMLEVGSLAEAQQVGLTRFVVPEHVQAFVDLHRQVLAGGTGLLEFEVVGRKGTRRWLETHAAPLVDPSGETLLLGVTRDVTDRKRSEVERTKMEAQLRIAERMEAVGQLAGGVAHDFNNLLSVINTTAELAMEAMAATDPLRADLAEILAAGGRAAGLTAQLLSFSRTQVFTPTLLDLNLVLLDLRPMLQRLIREHIELSIVPAPGPSLVLAPRDQLERVVMNLVVNARDAMPRGGRLTITLGEATFDAAIRSTTPALGPGSYVCLAVTDTGLGIAEDVLPRVFDPFFTTKERGRGTGLGLSSSYGFVVQCGGAFAVDSVPGTGTTFRVHFPRAAAGVAPTSPDRPPVPVASGSETILIVDDQEALVRVTRRTLEAVGYTTLSATSGAEALRLAATMQGALHLLLTDVVMPGMNGPELAARLVAVHPETRVLYMSGYADDDDLCRALLDRSATLIGKPYAAGELRRMVRAVLERPS